MGNDSVCTGMFHFIYAGLRVVAGIESPLETCPRENGEGGKGVVKNSGKTQPPMPPFVKGDLGVVTPLNQGDLI